MVSTTAPRPAHRAADLDTRERHLAACARALQAPRWQQRLAPLAQALVDLRLVRGRNEAGAPVRHLDAEVLRAVLCRLLGEGDERAYLTYQLLIEGTDAEWLAAERGTSVHVLTDQLRAAVQWVAATYEALA